LLGGERVNKRVDWWHSQLAAIDRYFLFRSPDLGNPPVSVAGVVVEEMRSMI
jgi:hypothetical protein